MSNNNEKIEQDITTVKSNKNSNISFNLVNWLDKNIDWNMIGVASIWLYLSFTFIFIFFR